MQILKHHYSSLQKLIVSMAMESFPRVRLLTQNIQLVSECYISDFTCRPASMSPTSVLSQMQNRMLVGNKRFTIRFEIFKKTDFTQLNRLFEYKRRFLFLTYNIWANDSLQTGFFIIRGCLFWWPKEINQKHSANPIRSLFPHNSKKNSEEIVKCINNKITF